MLSSKKPDKVKNKTKAFDPWIEEDNPEFISKCSGIFQPENENILDNWNCVYVQKELCSIAASDNCLHEAKEVWQRSDENSLRVCAIIDESYKIIH